MSKFFESQQVQEDLQSIFNFYKEISSETVRLGIMDKEEKLEHIEDCKTLIDKQKTYYTRLCLASKEDKDAADMKNRVNALTYAFGYEDLIECMNAMVATLEAAAKRDDL